MKEHNYAFQNADTRPRLQSRTQNIFFVISISAVILKRMVQITSILGSYSFLRITHVQYTQTDTIRQTDGPLVPLMAHWYQWYDWYQWRSTLFQWFYW